MCRDFNRIYRQRWLLGDGDSRRHAAFMEHQTEGATGGAKFKISA